MFDEINKRCDINFRRKKREDGTALYWGWD